MRVASVCLLSSVIILFFVCLKNAVVVVFNQRRQRNDDDSHQKKQSTINLLINGKHNHILLSWLKKYDDDDVLLANTHTHENEYYIIRKLKQFIFHGEELITIWKSFSGKFNKPPTIMLYVTTTVIIYRLLNKNLPKNDNDVVCVWLRFILKKQVK